MITQSIRLKIKAGTQPEFEALVAQLMRDVVANEPEAVYDVRRVRGQPLTYLYYFKFPDDAGYDRYMAADYHTQMSPKATAMLDGEPEFLELDQFD